MIITKLQPRKIKHNSISTEIENIFLPVKLVKRKNMLYLYFQKCYGYHDSSGKKCLFYFLVVLSLGALLLLLYWKPELECYLKKSKCALYKADSVLLLVS